MSRLFSLLFRLRKKWCFQTFCMIKKWMMPEIVDKNLVFSTRFVKYVFSCKIWFVKISTRIVKYESRVFKSNPVQEKTSGMKWVKLYQKAFCFVDLFPRSRFIQIRSWLLEIAVYLYWIWLWEERLVIGFCYYETSFQQNKFLMFSGHIEM